MWIVTQRDQDSHCAMTKVSLFHWSKPGREERLRFPAPFTQAVSFSSSAVSPQVDGPMNEGKDGNSTVSCLNPRCIHFYSRNFSELLIVQCFDLHLPSVYLFGPSPRVTVRAGVIEQRWKPLNPMSNAPSTLSAPGWGAWRTRNWHGLQFGKLG